MPKSPAVKVRFDATTAYWCVDAPPSISPTGVRLREHFRDEIKARDRAAELRQAVLRNQSGRKAISEDLARVAVYYDGIFQGLGYDGLESACREFHLRIQSTAGSPTLRSLVTAYLQEMPAPYNVAVFRRLEAALSPGLFDRETGTMDGDFWRDEISAAFRRRGWSAKTHNDLVSYLRSLFQFAVDNRKLPINPIAAIRPKNVIKRSAAIITPGQLRELLSTCLRDDPPIALYFAVLCFGGLRPVAEFSSPSGVTWEDVLWDRGVLRIRDTKNGQKTGQLNRFVTLNATLLSWLNAYKQDSGRICPKNWAKRYPLALEKVPSIPRGEQNRDLTRHSFGSYLAGIATADQVRGEMGHTSMAMFFRHYRHAVTREQAELYWSLTYEACGGGPRLTTSEVLHTSGDAEQSATTSDTTTDWDTSGDAR
jgi:integrase